MGVPLITEDMHEDVGSLEIDDYRGPSGPPTIIGGAPWTPHSALDGGRYTRLAAAAALRRC